MIMEEVREEEEKYVDYRHIILLGSLTDWPSFGYRPYSILPVTRFKIQAIGDINGLEYQVVTTGLLGEWCKDNLCKGSYVRVVGRILKYRNNKTLLLANTVEIIR